MVKRLKLFFSGRNLATMMLLFGQLLAALGAVVINILAARVLDPSDRGDLAFGLQVAYFLTVFATMGLERPYIAMRDGSFNSEYKNFTKLILPGVLLIVPIAILVTYFSPLGTAWMGYGVAAIGIYTALNAISRGVRVGYVVSRDWKKFSSNAIFSQLMIIAGAIVLVLLNIGNPIVWMFVYSASTIPAVLLLIQAASARERTETLSKREKSKIRKNGLILFPSEFSNTAMLRSDRLLLPILASSAELGLYVTVATVLEMASWPVKQWVDASLREWTTTKERLLAEVNSILLKSLALLVFASAILGVAAYLMILWVLPDSYLAATTAIVPLAIGAVIFGITRVQQGFLIVFGASGGVSFAEIMGIIFSLVSYFILIPRYGMLGAAYGSIIGYFVCYVVGFFILLKAKKGAK